MALHSATECTCTRILYADLQLSARTHSLVTCEHAHFSSHMAACMFHRHIALSSLSTKQVQELTCHVMMIGHACSRWPPAGLSPVYYKAVSTLLKVSIRTGFTSVLEWHVQDKHSMVSKSIDSCQIYTKG